VGTNGIVDIAQGYLKRGQINHTYYFIVRLDVVMHCLTRGFHTWSNLRDSGCFPDEAVTFVTNIKVYLFIFSAKTIYSRSHESVKG